MNHISQISPARISWLRGSLGVGLHWTTQSVGADGIACGTDYEKSVAAFDIDALVRALQKIKVKHCIFTLDHAEHYLPLPLTELDAILPGRTARRDLIGELLTALHKADIRGILYYNHSCNSEDDPVWKEAVGYTHGELDMFADHLCSMVGAMAKHYGTLLDGWWFDSCYSLDSRGPYNFMTRDVGDWQFPWDRFALAAKSGNPDAQLSFNAGVAERYLYTENQEYYSGEAENLDDDFQPSELDLLQRHRWVCMDNAQWVHRNAEFAPVRFSDLDLSRFLHGHLSQKTAVTLNLEISREGRLNPESIRQLERCIPNL